jgi:hypothetical protein
MLKENQIFLQSIILFSPIPLESAKRAAGSSKMEHLLLIHFGSVIAEIEIYMPNAKAVLT